MVRFAVLGCGRISGSHIPAVQQARDAELVAVCDIVEEKAREKGEAASVPYFTDLTAMLEEARPDVVIIGTPSGMHAEHTIICAEHGVNVLCEKPLDVTAEKIDAMIEACERNRVKLGGIFQRRTYTAALETRKAICEGKLGKLILCDGYFKYNRDEEYYQSDGWRGTWALDGGGALMNQCIHGIDMMMWLCGDVESVTAHCRTLARNIEVEDTAVILVQFKNGAVGVIEGATSMAKGEDTIFAIRGESGGVTFGDDSFYQWELNDDTPPPAVKDSQGGKNCGWVGVWEGHTHLVQDMAECVMTGREPVIPAREARKAVDFILAVYESSKNHKEVKLC